MKAYLLLLLLPLAASVKLALVTSGEDEYCAATRLGVWGRKGLSKESEKFSLTSCQIPQYSAPGVAIYINSTCNISVLSDNNYLAFKDLTVILSAPFSSETIQLLNSSSFSYALQVDGILQDQTEITVSPLKFSRIYWGAVIMYFYTLIFVSIGAVVIDCGQQVVSRHANRTSLDNVKCLQSRCFVIILAIMIGVIATAIFVGYLVQPIIFQPIFSTMLAIFATLGFYHLVFPVYVILAVKYIRVVNKSTWLLERTAVVGLGLIIFLLWVGYRNVTNMWPFQVFLFTCIAIVPLRFSPMNCIQKLTFVMFLLIFLMVLQSYILPAVQGVPPSIIDIVTVKATIPASKSPGPVFFVPEMEPKLMGLRVPLFGRESVCSRNIDSTVGIPSFILPAMFIKAALLMDKTVQIKMFRNSFYIVGVVMFLICHIGVFALSYLLEIPINGSFVYLPGIWLSLVITALRTGTFKQVLGPPVPEPSTRDMAVEEMVNLPSDSNHGNHANHVNHANHGFDLNNMSNHNVGTTEQSMITGM